MNGDREGLEAETVQKSKTHMMVLVRESESIRETVSYAVRKAFENSSEQNSKVLRFVYLDQHGNSSSGEQLLHKIRVWVNEELGTSEENFTVETDVVEQRINITDLNKLIKRVKSESRSHNIEEIVLDPSYEEIIHYPLIQNLENTISDQIGIRCDTPVSRKEETTFASLENFKPLSFLFIFGISFLFYQILGSGLTRFNLITGSLTSLITAFALSRLILKDNPSKESIKSLGRLSIFLPKLLWKIVEANIHVTRLILSPEMPVKPQFERIEPEIDGDFALTLLANSITLTPGTLTVRADEDSLLIHAIDDEARDDLIAGDIMESVRHVFHGKRGVIE